MRLMLLRTTCMKGKDAAELFYSNRFVRKGASPEPIRATLFGKGGVQEFDQREHHHRKKLFMPFMNPEEITDLFQLTRNIWMRRLRNWVGTKEINLYEEAQLIHTEAICEWFGIPLRRDQIPEKARELTMMFDYAAAKDLSYLKARFRRRKTEQWIISLIEDIRKKPKSHEDTHLKRFSLYRDLRGELLPSKIAATEVLSTLRPAVAVSLYVVFLAHALHQFPDRARLIQSDSDRFSFIQEVRRFYPFFPVVPARAKATFVWRNHEFVKGQLVLLDLYGTNHDERIWKHPEHFMPERFDNRTQNPFDFIPQGGGDHATGHRCPGELITLGFMDVALHCLLEDISYDVPTQDLGINFKRLPAIINSHMILTNVRPKTQRTEERLSVNFFQE
ncbi:cytochrome P450 [Peredibacter sp. HCB2-198]|uniref:cytochrome P450 n=1 Tax=Peredibacter sp. HCB2-198 TaxID=3383025 RepID=UPI0038B4AF21